MVPGVAEEEMNNIDENRFENPCQLSEESRTAFLISIGIPPKSLFISYHTSSTT